MEEPFPEAESTEAEKSLSSPSGRTPVVSDVRLPESTGWEILLLPHKIVQLSSTWKFVALKLRARLYENGEW